MPRYNTLVASNDSPNQKKPTAVTNVVPNALQTAYATDTSILAKLILNPTILRVYDNNKAAKEDSIRGYMIDIQVLHAQLI